MRKTASRESGTDREAWAPDRTLPRIAVLSALALLIGGMAMSSSVSAYSGGQAPSQAGECASFGFIGGEPSVYVSPGECVDRIVTDAVHAHP